MKIGESFTFIFEETSDFKYIITTSCPLEENENELKKSIESVLEEAESNNIYSICLPIVYSGDHDFDFEKAVQIISNQTKIFLQNRSKNLSLGYPKKKIKNLDLVIF